MDEGPERPGDFMENGVCVCVWGCVSVGLFHKISAELCTVDGGREDMQILGEESRRENCCSWWLYIMSHHDLAEAHLFCTISLKRFQGGFLLEMQNLMLSWLSILLF